VTDTHPAGTIVDVRCRLFEAPTTGGGVRYANPLRAWDPARDERGFSFPRWLVVEVETSAGIVGIGNAGLAADLLPPIVETRLKPVVLGRPLVEIQESWQLMYRSTMAWGRKGLGMVAISAVDIALWDALGKSLGVPVHDVLGGRRHGSIPVYASRLYGSDSLDDLAQEAQRYVDQGFAAFKQRFLWGPRDGRKGMRANVELVRTVREVVGDDADLMADAYQGWNLDYARAMVRLLEPYDLRWLEEPLIPDDLEGYAQLTRQSPIPIAHGEHEFTIAGFGEIVRRGAARVLQLDTNRVGGITQAVKVCALAEAFGLEVVPHAGQVHNYHVVASQPACSIAEYFPPEAIEVGNELPHWLFEGEPRVERGHVTLNAKPGLGIEVAPRAPVHEISL
jgi:L-alanine-DL-glutamate epimerase-like enolase superfamily enzyme